MASQPCSPYAKFQGMTAKLMDDAWEKFQAALRDYVDKWNKDRNTGWAYGKPESLYPSYWVGTGPGPAGNWATGEHWDAQQVVNFELQSESGVTQIAIRYYFERASPS